MEIKTNSSLGSDEYVWLTFRDAQIDIAGGFRMKFSVKPRHIIPWCSPWTDFPATLPSAAEKKWRITLDKAAGIRVLVHCNGELVLNVLLSDEVCTNYPTSWSNYWSRSVTKINFYRKDTASDYYYKPKQGDLCTTILYSYSV